MTPSDIVETYPEDDERRECNVPIRFMEMVQRLNEVVLARTGERVIYQAERGVWRHIDLAKGKPLTVHEVEAIARKLGAIEPNEVVMPLR